MAWSRRKRVVGWLVAIALSAACAGPRGGWHYSDLPSDLASRPEVRNSRLFDSAPHWAPYKQGLLLFLCRWTGPEAIPVSLPPNADSRELRIMRMALEAWSNAGLGIRFQEVVPAAARMEIVFAPVGKGSPRGSGDALADCAVDIGPVGAVIDEGRVQARIVWASIHLSRGKIDVLGREIALDDDELLGAVLHEMGHALGYSGHPVQGHSIMQRTTDEVRKIGVRVASGAPLVAPNLRALYALPSGVVIGHIPLPSASARFLEHFDANAKRVGFRGPYSRVGDLHARYFYRDAQRVPYAVTTRLWLRSRAEPGEISFEANAAAKVLLGLGTSSETQVP